MTVLAVPITHVVPAEGAVTVTVYVGAGFDGPPPPPVPLGSVVAVHTPLTHLANGVLLQMVPSGNSVLSLLLSN